MSPRPCRDDWDFSPVIDLIYSLSTGEEAYTQIRKTECFSKNISDNENEIVHDAQLGNFDSIWQYLGQPLDLLPPNIPPVSEVKPFTCLESNGVEEHFALKEVRWRDEIEGADLADNDEKEDPFDLSGLTKAQRKKARRKQRQQDRAEVSANGRAPYSGSEDESGKEIQLAKTSDRQAIIYEILHGTSNPTTTTGRLRSGKVFRSDVLGDSGALAVASPPSSKQSIQILKPQRESSFAIAAAKKTKLMAMLTETFIDERQYLSDVSFIPSVSINTENAGEGIHVFVDASNVWLCQHTLPGSISVDECD